MEVKVCRFCLNDEKMIEYIDIFNSLSAEFTLKIENCLSMQIQENDGFPTFACLQCIGKINSFDTFKRMCHISYGHLLESKQQTLIEQTDNVNYVKSEDISDNDDVKSNISNTNINNTEVNGKTWLFSRVDEGILEIIGNNIYTCDICNGIFDSFAEYQDHQETHNGKLVFKCDECQEVFDKRKLLVEHEKKHKVECKICHITVLRRSLRAHSLLHTDIHKCSICSMRHQSKASLEKHIRALHAKEKGFICHVCGKQNSCQSSMKRHMAYHSNERPYKCQYCDFSAKSLNIVQVHTSRKHFAESRVCEICAKIFKSQPSLVQHMKRIHSDRRHNCTVCGKEFVEKYKLNKHMERHRKQRLYDCKVCQKEFFTVRRLKEHMHSHKQGCVSCPKCAKEFFYKKYLEKHVAKCNK